MLTIMLVQATKNYAALLSRFGHPITRSINVSTNNHQLSKEAKSFINLHTPQSLLREPYVVGVQGVGDPCRPTGSIPRGVAVYVY